MAKKQPAKSGNESAKESPKPLSPVPRRKLPRISPLPTRVARVANGESAGRVADPGHLAHEFGETWRLTEGSPLQEFVDVVIWQRDKIVTAVEKDALFPGYNPRRRSSPKSPRDYR